MITVVPFEMEHLDLLIPTLRDHDAKMVVLHGGEVALRQMFEALSKFAIMNSFVTERGEVVAVWVFVQKWPGVAQCFAWTSTLVDVMPKEFWKACKRGLESAQEAIECHRMEADVRLDHPHGVRWLQKLGFKIEGCMRQYGVDKMDSYLLGKVW